MSACLGLFYVQSLGRCVLSTFIFTSLVQLFLQRFVCRVFANKQRDRGSISGLVIPKIQKWYFISPCLILCIFRYVSKVKGSNPGKGVAHSHLDMLAFEKGAFESPVTTVANFTYSHRIWRFNQIYLIHRWDPNRFNYFYEIWGIWSISSLPLLPGTLWTRSSNICKVPKSPWCYSYSAELRLLSKRVGTLFALMSSLMSNRCSRGNGSENTPHSRTGALPSDAILRHTQDSNQQKIANAFAGQTEGDIDIKYKIFLI